MLNFSLATAFAFGCNPIICVGIDLAYTGGKSYGSGLINHPLHSDKSHFRTKSQYDNIVTATDVHQEPILTLWKWLMESGWYTDFALLNPDLKIINATEGGIGFQNIENMTLADVNAKFLTKSYDLSALLHGRIQDAAFPSNVTKQAVKGFIQKIMESLAACTRLITNLLAKDESQDEKELKEELGYKAVIAPFNEAYLELEKPNLRIDANKVISNWKMRLGRLLAVAETNRHIFRLTLEADDKEQVTKSETITENPTDPFQGDIYLFEDKCQKLFDKDLELSFEADEPLNRFEKRLFSCGETGSKQESYYLDGLLHGPSSYYNKEGSI